jgi:hypothetical protein
MCGECGATTRIHAKGLCRVCYTRALRRGQKTTKESRLDPQVVAIQFRQPMVNAYRERASTGLPLFDSADPWQKEDAA